MFVFLVQCTPPKFHVYVFYCFVYIASKIIDGRTDGRADGRTDGRTRRRLLCSPEIFMKDTYIPTSYILKTNFMFKDII